MPRLLLVEDNEMNRDMLTRRLTRRGFEVAVAVDGIEALEKANQVTPDLILMDLTLPELDGWEVTRLLKADERTQQIPVIALTAHAMSGDRERAIEAGCDEYATKPVDMDDLLTRIERALARRRDSIAEADTILPPNTPSTVAQTSPERSRPLQTARLLVVDDNADNRDMLSRRLQRRGYDVEIAADGPSALAKIGSGGFDLVLLDVMMPGMSGLEVLAEVRKTHPRTELPIIMATAKTDSQDVIDALSLGANDYVTKPLEFDVVQARVQSHLATRLESQRPRSETRRIRKLERGATLEERYELQEELGKGGCAVVYAATQLSTGQRVAVKIIEIELGDDIARERFRREMDVIGRLRHPHIVRLIDSGEVEQLRTPSDGQPQLVCLPYLVMELLEGEPLSSQLHRAGRVTFELAADIALPVVSALATAHELGIVHRDIKPANIFLTRGTGKRLHPVVLDFGIAKHRALGPEEMELTTEEAMVGTPRYLAPEQARGASSVDARADQFSLAMVLVECLAGQSMIPPGIGLFQALYMITSGDMPSVRELVPDIPADLEASLNQAMSQKAADRFPSMAHLGLALLPFASDATRAIWTDEMIQRAAEVGAQP